jgi:hypothetical protein
MRKRRPIVSICDLSLDFAWVNRARFSVHAMTGTDHDAPRAAGLSHVGVLDSLESSVEGLPRAGVLAAGPAGLTTGIHSAKALRLRGEVDMKLSDTPAGRIQQVIDLFHAYVIDTRDAFELINGHLDGAPPAGTYYEPPPDEDEEEG